MIRISSAGLRHGDLPDANLTVDLRGIPNPHSNRQLRAKTGLDPAVKKAVLKYESVRELIVSAALQAVVGDVESVLFYCLGGRHRSVVAAEECARLVRKVAPCSVVHRDLVHRDLAGT